MDAAHALWLEAKVLTRDGVVPVALADRLQRGLEQLAAPLDGSVVATLAAIAVARGELRHARLLFESVAWLPPSAVSREVRDYARGWLSCDAAAAGDWARVERLAVGDDLEARFFGALAARMQGGPATLSGDDRLRLPREAVGFFELGPRSAPPRVADEGALAELLRRALTLSALTANETARAASALLAAPWLRQHLLERATLLGGGDPDEALAELRAAVVAHLGSALTDAVDAPLLAEAAQQRRESILHALEQRLDGLVLQCEAERPPPVPTLWREVASLVADVQLATRLSDVAARAVPHAVVARRLRFVATWLRVVKDEQAFAKALFGQLERLARDVDDEVAAALAAMAGSWCRA